MTQPQTTPVNQAVDDDQVDGEQAAADAASDAATGDVDTGDPVFDAYTQAFARAFADGTGNTGGQGSGDGGPDGAGGGALLGHLVLYSIFDGDVTRDELARWFTELGLDPDLVPPALRPVDAYEKVTGPDGVRLSYPLPLDDVADLGRRARRSGRGPGRGTVTQQATLMVRPVRRDGGEIVRHVVREVRDEQNTRLSYDPCLAACVFRRDNTAGAAEGAGELAVEPNGSAIDQLPPAEQAAVRHMLSDIQVGYSRRCTYLTGDKLRGVIRGYIESLDAIRVRPTGGVYFVHAHHAPVLAALRTLVARFAAGSHLVRIPLPNIDEMRQMIIAAFTTKAADDLNRLAADVAAAQADARTGSGVTTAAVQRLYRRFADLQQATGQHAQLLSTSLDDTQAALRLVQTQLGSLLAAGTSEDNDDPADDRTENTTTS